MDNNNKKDEATPSARIGCHKEGCSNEACCACKGCGDAHYCCTGHAMADWKNHCMDCNLNISEIAGDVLFATEFNARSEQANNTNPEIAEWVPVALAHVKIGAHGDFQGMMFNADVSKHATGGEETNVIDAITPVESAVFSGKTVFPGSRANQVPGGQKRYEGMAEVTVIAASSEYSSNGDLADFRAVVPLKDNSVRGGQGLTVALTEKDLNTVRASGGQKLNNFTNQGRVMVALTVGADTFQVSGVFTIPRPPKRSVSKAARRVMGQYDVIRIIGKDPSTLIQASLTFERPRGAGDAGIFILTGVRIHTPKAAQPNVPKGLTPAAVFAAQSSVFQEPPATTESMIADINLEVPSDVLAVVDTLADLKDSLQKDFNDAQVNAPENAKLIGVRLEKAASLWSLLQDHASVLIEEESGKRPAVNIDQNIRVAVNEAIEMIETPDVGIEMIEAPNVGRYARERMEEAQFKRSVSRMKKTQLYARWKELVDQTQTLRDSGQVGSHALRMARIAYGRLVNKGMINNSDTDFKQYAAKYRNLIATEKDFRKGKKQEASSEAEAQKEQNRQRMLEARYTAGGAATAISVGAK